MPNRSFEHVTQGLSTKSGITALLDISFRAAVSPTAWEEIKL